MTPVPAAMYRAVESLANHSGRTVVVAGPAMSGKSAVLEEVTGRLRNEGVRVLPLKGSYRSRAVPLAAVGGLVDNGAPASAPGDEEESATLPVTAVPYVSGVATSSRRSRGQRARTNFLGQPVRGRAANALDAETYWQGLVKDARVAASPPVAIIIDDGSIFDNESREFILFLSRRARLIPLLIVVALDSSVPGFIAWEDQFVGRGDVDWVRFSQTGADLREQHRLKEQFDELPRVTQRVMGYTSLLGGSVGEVVLSRVTRLGFPQLAEAILPATSANLVRLQDGKVSLAHPTWAQVVPTFIPPQAQKEMHLEIANALSALSPEPGLQRQMEIAQHYMAWFPGPMAYQHLLSAAELSIELLAFDQAEELLAAAIQCVPALPAKDREPIEGELRLLRARSLFYAGRLHEAEDELRAGMAGAVTAGVAPEVLEEWVEPLVLALRVVGPRPSLATLLRELADRCHEDKITEVEVLFQSVIAEYEAERSRADRARSEAHRAALLARHLKGGHAQAVALMTVGLSRIDGSPDEQRLAERFLRSARLLLGQTRRYELDSWAEDLEARLLEARGQARKALEIRERRISSLQRLKLGAVELYHQLGIVELRLDQDAVKGIEAPLRRARTLAETLHLVPPSPALLRLWLLEGRQAAANEIADSARDLWTAVIDEPGPLGLPRLQVEAMIRLALLYHSTQRAEEARDLEARVLAPENVEILSMKGRTWIAGLDAAAAESQLGAGRLPAGTFAAWEP